MHIASQDLPEYTLNLLDPIASLKETSECTDDGKPGPNCGFIKIVSIWPPLESSESHILEHHTWLHSVFMEPKYFESWLGTNWTGNVTDNYLELYAVKIWMLSLLTKKVPEIEAWHILQRQKLLIKGACINQL